MQAKARVKKILFRAGVIAAWLLLWQLASLWVDAELLLPAPGRTLQRLWELAQTAPFWQAAGLTLLRMVEGCLIGILCGTVLGVLTAASRALEAFFQPLFTVVKATPVASFIILALVWLRKDSVPTFAAGLMVMPILWANVNEGIRQTPGELLEMAASFRFSRGKQIHFLYLPQTLPYFYAGCSSSIGLAWKAGVAAEVLVIPLHAIGTQLNNARFYLETADMFAWTALVILLSVVLEKLVARLLDTRR